MKFIELSNSGHRAIVDDKDYEDLRHFKWMLVRHNRTLDSKFAATNLKTDYGIKFVRMHRYILGIGRDQIVGFRNRNGLDCRRSNLLVGTKGEIGRMNAKSLKSRSRFKGVSRPLSEKRYKARIQIGGVRYFLGRFVTSEEAALAYNEAAKKLHGEYARLNNI